MTLHVKDYREVGDQRYTTMALATSEFIRRFLLHVLPKGLHRIRYYGLFASGQKAENLDKMRDLLGVMEATDRSVEDDEAGPASPLDDDTAQPCPCCGGKMRIIEVFNTGCTPRHVLTPEGIDSS